MYYNFINLCTSFEYVYKFCVRIRLWFYARCFAFVYLYGFCSLMRVWRTYTPFLRPLSGFWVQIWLFVGYEQLLRTDIVFKILESLGHLILRYFYLLEVLIIRSWGFVYLLELPMIQSQGLLDSSKVRANVRDDRTVWSICLEDPIFRVPCPSICTLWLDPLEDLLSRVLLSSLYENLHMIHRLILPDRVLIRRSSCNSPSDLTSDYFLLIL